MHEYSFRGDLYLHSINLAFISFCVFIASSRALSSALSLHFSRYPIDYLSSNRNSRSSNERGRVFTMHNYYHHRTLRLSHYHKYG